MRGYGLDDLYEHLSKQQEEELGEDFIDEEYIEGEETETKDRLYDYADRQLLWSTPEDESGWVQLPPTNLVQTRHQ